MKPSGSMDLESCPVSDDMLKRLVDTTADAVAEIGVELPERQRAALAVFCYRRAHFRVLGLALAALCSERALVQEAGVAGEIIHRQARSGGKTESSVPPVSRGGRPAVSLHVV